MVADAAWPTFDPALLVDDQVTLAVQVNGKLRDTLTAPRGLDRAAAEALALASDKVQRQLAGAQPAQGHCRSRPAGEYRRMMRRLALICSRSLLLAGCGLHPLYGGGVGRPGRGDAALGPGRRRSPARSGWLVRNKLVDRLGEAGSGTPHYRLDVDARRQHHRVRHPRRPRGDPGAADAARALPAGRPAQRRRWCSTRRPDPTPASTSSAPNMRPSPPSRPRSSTSPRSSPTRSSRGSALYASRDRRRSESDQGQSIGRAVDQPDRDSPLLSVPRPRRGAVARARRSGCSRRSARAKFVLAGGAVKSDPALLADEAGAMSLFGGNARDLDRARRRGHRRRRRGAARGAGRRKPGGRDRRRAAQDLGAAQARRSSPLALAFAVLCARRRRTPSGW